MNDKIAESYRVLEIKVGASLEEVKQARRLLAKVWHPDRFPTDKKLREKGLAKLFEINRAYDVLEEYLQSAGSSSDSPRPEPEIRRRQPASRKPYLWFAAAGLAALFVILDLGVRLTESRRGAYSPEAAAATPVAQKDDRPTPVPQPIPDRPQVSKVVEARTVAVSHQKPEASESAPMSKEPARQSEEEIVKQIWDNARKKARADAEEAARVATLEKERVAAEQKARKAAEIAGARRPRPLSQPQIGFPKDLSEKGLSQGWAIVSFTVETDGQVRTARAVRSSHPEFAAAAVDGVRKWLFQPGQREGRTVPWQMEVPVIFNPLPAETPKRR